MCCTWHVITRSQLSDVSSKKPPELAPRCVPCFVTFAPPPAPPPPPNSMIRNAQWTEWHMTLMARSREYQGERKLRINVQRVSETATRPFGCRSAANPAQAACVRTGCCHDPGS